jgi:hypothetical protein
MSSPATAGVVALMLEANPTLTPGDVRAILELTAREDDDTGTLPVEGDLVWGHGKVTASQAVLTSLSWVSNVGLPFFPAPEDGAELLVYPNPTQDRVWVAGIQDVTGTWVLVDMQGHVCGTGRATPWFDVDLTGLPAGVYVLRTTEPDGTVRAARVAKRP